MKIKTFLIASVSMATAAFTAETAPKQNGDDLETRRRAAYEQRTRALTGPTLTRPIEQLVTDLLGREELYAKRERLPYKSIRLVRGPCFGSCPVFTFEVFRNGEARLDAQKFMPETGHFIGKLNATTYARLCLALDRFEFRNLKERYTADWTDSATYYVTAISDTGEKTVEDYGSVGPLELWLIQELLDSVRLQIKWKPDPSTNPSVSSEAK